MLPRLVPPDCCPFHASGGTWDAGHSQTRTGGFYEIMPGSDVAKTRDELIALVADLRERLAAKEGPTS